MNDNLKPEQAISEQLWKALPEEATGLEILAGTGYFVYQVVDLVAQGDKQAALHFLEAITGAAKATVEKYYDQR